jgi:hypothetical protein
MLHHYHLCTCIQRPNSDINRLRVEAGSFRIQKNDDSSRKSHVFPFWVGIDFPDRSKSDSLRFIQIIRHILLAVFMGIHVWMVLTSHDITGLKSILARWFWNRGSESKWLGSMYPSLPNCPYKGGRPCQVSTLGRLSMSNAYGSLTKAFQVVYAHWCWQIEYYI